MLVIWSRGLYNAVTYAIYNTSRELLWLPLTAEERLRMKTFVNGIVRSSSRALGASISMSLTTSLDGKNSKFIR